MTRCISFPTICICNLVKKELRKCSATLTTMTEEEEEEEFKNIGEKMMHKILGRQGKINITRPLIFILFICRLQLRTQKALHGIINGKCS